jgi:hypothetical protein
MGFFKKLLFGEKDEKETKLEKEVKENIEKGADYSHAMTENQVICNGCGQIIEGKPRVRNHMGRIMLFHKRCWKAMLSGQLPKPLPEKEINDNQTTNQE